MCLRDKRTETIAKRWIFMLWALFTLSCFGALQHRAKNKRLVRLIIQYANVQLIMTKNHHKVKLRNIFHTVIFSNGMIYEVRNFQKNSPKGLILK